MSASRAGVAPPPSTPTRAARFIDPRILAGIGNLDLLARIVVDGFVGGLHRAVHLGVSTEFAEHRAYAPGDDVRRVDWRVFARTDRVYVKTYEAETNADLVLALDTSRSMEYQGLGLRKLDYARFIMASLAHLAGRQRDRVGLSLFDQTVRKVIPPSVRHRDRVLHALEAVRPGPGSDLVSAMESLAASLTRRGIVVVVSDFYFAPDDTLRALDGLRVRGHDVIAIHLLDPVERRLELEGVTVVEDMESGERLPLLPDTLRGEYQKLLQEHVEILARTCGEHGIDYACFDTGMPLDHVLYRYLSQRARQARVR